MLRTRRLFPLVSAMTLLLFIGVPRVSADCTMTGNAVPIADNIFYIGARC